MKRLATTVAFGGAYGVATTAQGQEEALTVPSGLQVALMETLLEPPLMRLRFVAPAITADNIEQNQNDMQTLCQTFIENGQIPRGIDQVAVSIASEPVPFGEVPDGILQVFELYSIVENTCVWEEF